MNRAMTSNENQEDNLRPCWTMNQSFLIFHIYFYSCLMTKYVKVQKGPQDVSALVLFLNSPCVTKNIFSSKYEYIIVKQTGIK